MAILTEVKCSRCDKRYSALRGRCPYCGARRSSKGKYSGDPDDMKGRTIVGVLILIALLAAVITLIIISVRSGDDKEVVDAGISSLIIDDSTNTALIDDTPTPSPSPVEVSFEPPPPAVQSVTITYAGSTTVDFTEPVGTTLTLKAKILPADIDLVPEWSSSNPVIFEVVPEDTSGLSVKVTMLSRGRATLICTVGDKIAECVVRVS